jgi:hypothetical protein
VAIYSILIPTCYFVHFQLGGFSQGIHAILFATVPYPLIFLVKSRKSIAMCL